MLVVKKMKLGSIEGVTAAVIRTTDWTVFLRIFSLWQAQRDAYPLTCLARLGLGSIKIMTNDELVVMAHRVTG